MAIADIYVVPWVRCDKHDQVLVGMDGIGGHTYCPLVTIDRPWSVVLINDLDYDPDEVRHLSCSECRGRGWLWAHLHVSLAPSHSTDVVLNCERCNGWGYLQCR